MQTAFYDSFQGTNNGKSKRMRSQSFMQGNTGPHTKTKYNHQKSHYNKHYPLRHPHEHHNRSRYAINDDHVREKMNRKEKLTLRYDSEPKAKDSPYSVKKRRNSGNYNSKYDSPFDDDGHSAKQLDGFKIVHNGDVILDMAKTNAELYEQAMTNAKLYSEVFASSVMITGPKQEQISLPSFYMVQEARS